jgi:hypothetical protein
MQQSFHLLSHVSEVGNCGGLRLITLFRGLLQENH